MVTRRLAPHADALNLAIRCALASPFDEFLFAEHDLICRAADLEPFWQADADVVRARSAKVKRRSTEARDGLLQMFVCTV